MSAGAAAPGTVPFPAPKEERDRRYLFGPVIDFLCLGGSSLLILPILMLVPVEGNRAVIVIAHFVNHPHFARSYMTAMPSAARCSYSSHGSSSTCTTTSSTT
jgi:hypothetical protein